MRALRRHPQLLDELGLRAPGAGDARALQNSLLESDTTTDACLQHQNRARRAQRGIIRRDDDYSGLNEFTCSQDPGAGALLPFDASYGKPVSVHMSPVEHATCTLFDSGAVVCWGQTAFMLGVDGLGFGATHRNTERDSLSFVPIDFGGASVKSLSMGGYHACALLDDDSLRCWGDNSYGQLGTGNRRDVGTGKSGAIPVAQSSAVALWDTSAPPVQVAAGALTTCALLANGRAACWGMADDTFPLLGVDVVHQQWAVGTKPYDVAGLSPIVFGDSSVLVTHISSGVTHSCAVTTDGEVFCWGFSLQGALGLRVQQQIQPAEVRLGAGRSAVRVWAEETGTCALLTSGDVQCWGVMSADLVERQPLEGVAGGACRDAQSAQLVPLVPTLPARGNDFSLAWGRNPTACVAYDTDNV